MQTLFLYTYTETDSGTCAYQFYSDCAPRPDDYIGADVIDNLVLTVTEERSHDRV